MRTSALEMSGFVQDMFVLQNFLRGNSKLSVACPKSLRRAQCLRLLAQLVGTASLVMAVPFRGYLALPKDVGRLTFAWGDSEPDILVLLASNLELFRLCQIWSPQTGLSTSFRGEQFMPYEVGARICSLVKPSKSHLSHEA